MRLRLAQLNPTVGDIQANARLVERAIDDAAGADLLILPELILCGYPPRDLLLREGFVRRCEAEANRLAERTPAGLTVLLSLPMRCRRRPGLLTNSLLAIRGGEIVARYDKRLLPTYDVFDEDRYFVPGHEPVVIDVAGVPVGLSICEDLWRGEDAGTHNRYHNLPDPIAELAEAGARVIASPSASPFVLGKGTDHRALLKKHATHNDVWVAAVNQVGANDDLIFDGHGALVAPDGALALALPGFQEAAETIEIDPGSGAAPPRTDPLTEADPNRLTLDALTLATRDYLHKSRFERAVIGLSGGIDSALTATIAARALGPESVVGAKMPSPISSEHSVTDAEDLADRLGIRLLSMPVDTARDGLAAAIDPALAELGQPPLGGQTPDLAAENLQSRARGALMMTLSNRTGSLMLTTGNKSELAVGYCTLYGDMNGALGVIGDLLKSRVFELARWINANHRACGFDRAPIPESTITKPPSAELAPGQLDQDTLPPYDILDQIIERFVEREQSPATIASQTGIARDLVETIVRMIDLNEYKRFQYAVVPKISPRAFGPGRRIPIVKR